jgi:streptogramin lyase
LEFDLHTKNYTIHDLEDVNLITFSVVDKGNPNRIWYVDPTQNMIGSYDVLSQKQDNYNNTIEGVISGLTMDESQNIWMTSIHANKIVKFNSIDKTFEGFDIPTKNSIPLNIIYDRIRKMFGLLNPQLEK